MVKYCPKCGAENEDDGEFCTECGNDLIGKTNKSNNNSSVSISKKTLLIGAVAIIIIVFVGLFALTGGNLADVQYISSNPITVDSVTVIQQGELEEDNYTDTGGATKTYKVAYTANENLDNVSIECYAYTPDGTALSTVEILFTSLNVVLKNGNITQGSTYTGNVVFGTPNSTANFDASKFEFFVYQNDGKEVKLIDKFTYNV